MSKRPAVPFVVRHSWMHEPLMFSYLWPDQRWGGFVGAQRFATEEEADKAYLEWWEQASPSMQEAYGAFQVVTCTRALVDDPTPEEK